jgi:hypothetical protein
VPGRQASGWLGSIHNSLDGLGQQKVTGRGSGLSGFDGGDRRKKRPFGSDKPPPVNLPSGANGELGFHIVSNGRGKPYAIQVRGPGFPILSALPRLIKGHAVADLIPIFDSINMIGGEVEQ